MERSILFYNDAKAYEGKKIRSLCAWFLFGKVRFDHDSLAWGAQGNEGSHFVLLIVNSVCVSMRTSSWKENVKVDFMRWMCFVCFDTNKKLPLAASSSKACVQTIVIEFEIQIKMNHNCNCDWRLLCMWIPCSKRYMCFIVASDYIDKD